MKEIPYWYLRNFFKIDQCEQLNKINTCTLQGKYPYFTWISKFNKYIVNYVQVRTSHPY